MCRVYGVTRAGYYAWRSRERSERERQNETLRRRSAQCTKRAAGIYGSPRFTGELRKPRPWRGQAPRGAPDLRAHRIKARSPRFATRVIDTDASLAASRTSSSISS